MTNAQVAVGNLRPSFSLTLVRGGLRLLGRTSPSIASRVAETLFMTPRRFAPPERERRMLETARPFDVRGGKNRIRAWSWGEGPLVLLVHGWEGRGAQLAPFVGPLVERGYRVVTFDAPGHGESPGRRSSLPHFAWAVRTVADAVDTPRAIVAHSFGCAATTLALHEGLRSERVVFISPPLDPVTYTDRFAEILGLDSAVVDGMRERIEARFLRKWTDYSVANLARNQEAPLLVVHDRDDHETLLEEGRAVAEAWKRAELLVTEGLGHRRILRDPDVVKAVVRFIDRR